MTRINAGIQVEKLTDQHLVAEYREILRVGTLFKKRIEADKKFNDVPLNFVFGKGHVSFFFSKGYFINQRWQQLVHEMKNRGFNPTLKFLDHWEGYPQYNLDYVPPIDVTKLVKERIKSNIQNQKSPIRYKSLKMAIDEYFEILDNPLTD
jgi:deoxyribonuclease (pyrimidine dimer)